MTYTPTIYDWRDDVTPINQVFRAAGQATDGGMTLGGVSVESPEPGGRAELALEFSAFATEAANLNASWTVSRICNGNVMRVRLWDSVQLVKGADLFGSAADHYEPISDSPASDGEPTRWAPQVPVAAAAAKGAASFTVDMTDVGEILRLGHVIGFNVGGYDFAHMVMDITYAAGVATVEVSPPLRRALTTSDAMLFRPAMLVTCRNAREVMSNFTSGRHMQLNGARFAEALV